jgi:hypothetical protein
MWRSDFAWVRPGFGDFFLAFLLFCIGSGVLFGLDVRLSEFSLGEPSHSFIT